MATDTNHEDTQGVDADFVPTPVEGLAGVELDGEVVIHHEEQDTLHVLNPTAAIVWASFGDGRTVATIIEELADIFAVAPQVIEQDVVPLIADLGRQGLLEGLEPDPDVVADRRMPEHVHLHEEGACD